MRCLRLILLTLLIQFRKTRRYLGWWLLKCLLRMFFRPLLLPLRLHLLSQQRRRAHACWQK